MRDFMTLQKLPEFDLATMYNLQRMFQDLNQFSVCHNW